MKKNISRSVALLSFIIFLFLFEAVARLAIVVSSYSFGIRSDQLDDYERLDPENKNNWLLVPGYEATIAEMFSKKMRAGKVLTTQILQKMLANREIADSTIALYINSLGYRGQELKKLKPSLRVLALGDSCTFGFFGAPPWPEVLEMELEHNKASVEVINAGVEGYSAINLLYRAREFKKLEADIILIYIGWNDIFKESPYNAQTINFLFRNCKSCQLTKEAFQGLPYLFSTPSSVARVQFAKKKFFAKRESPSLDRFEHLAISIIEKLITELKTDSNEIYLITLPGLYSTSLFPDQLSLSKGHLPEFTSNAHDLALLTESFNRQLIKLAHKKILNVIELHSWLEDQKLPRAELFFDSVHLYPSGQYLLGKFIAHRLLRSSQLLAPIIVGTKNNVTVRDDDT